MSHIELFDKPVPVWNRPVRSRVTCQKGSWKYQNAWCTSYYGLRQARDGRMLYTVSWKTRKYAVGPRIGYPDTDAVYTLDRREAVLITDDFGDMIAVGVIR